MPGDPMPGDPMPGDPMPDRLDEVLADLAAESSWLDALVSPLDEGGWRRPTPADGWDVATSIAHLAWTDEVAVLAATDKQRWDEAVVAALADPEGFVDTEALAGGAVPPDRLLARWRAARTRLAEVLRELPLDNRIPWYGPPMSATSMATARYMESWAHGLDVAHALGVEVEPHDRVRHVVHLGVRTRRFSFLNRGLPEPTEPVFASLAAPSGARWEYGEPEAADRVTGDGWDFALLVTQRRHRADLRLTTEGEAADRWLDVAQAFAGPPGGGRMPTGAAT